MIEMLNRTLFLTLFLSLSFYGNLYSQKEWDKFDTLVVPVIGKKFNSFNIHDDGNTAFFRDTISKYYGKKYLILDFFSSGCTSCFKSFPKINEMQAKFGDKLQIIQMGFRDKYIRKFYGVYAKNIKENIPVVFDSLFVTTMVPIGFPHLIWLDKDSIVRAVTSSIELNEENISKFVNDQSFNFRDKSHLKYIPAYSSQVYDKDKFDWYWAIDRNGNKSRLIDSDTNALYSSQIGVWEDHMYYEGVHMEYGGPNKGHAIIGTSSIEELFLFAYYGAFNFQFHDINLKGKSGYGKLLDKIYPRVSIAGLDSSYVLGLRSKPNDRAIYWYKLIDRRSVTLNDSTLLLTMREDIKLKFPNIEAKVIRAKRKYYALIKTKDFNQINIQPAASTRHHVIDVNNTQIVLENVSWSTFVNNLFGHFLNPLGRECFLDETGLGIDSPVSIELHGDLFDIENINLLISKYGIKLVEKERDFDILELSAA